MNHELPVLLSGLASPDPSVRDGWAYQELAEGIESGRFAAEWDIIRATSVDRLRSVDVQARTFAPLVLHWLLLAGDRNEAAFEAVARWYPSENDTRGFDPDLGWLHAVAHGADYLGSAARAGLADGSRVLDLLGRRVVAPGPGWLHQEQARVSVAVVCALSAGGEVEALTGPIDAALTSYEAAADTAEPGPPPAWLSNTYTTLATLHLAITERPLPGQDIAPTAWSSQLAADVAQQASRMTPWLFVPRAVPMLHVKPRD